LYVCLPSWTMAACNKTAARRKRRNAKHTAREQSTADADVQEVVEGTEPVQDAKGLAETAVEQPDVAEKLIGVVRNAVEDSMQKISGKKRTGGSSSGSSSSSSSVRLAKKKPRAKPAKMCRMYTEKEHRAALQSAFEAGKQAGRTDMCLEWERWRRRLAELRPATVAPAPPSASTVAPARPDAPIVLTGKDKKQYQMMLKKHVRLYGGWCQ